MSRGYWQRVAWHRQPANQASWRLLVVVFVDVRRHALAVTQPRAGRSLVRSRSLNLRLAVRVECVVERPHQDQFFVIVRYAQLESTDECVQTGRLRSTGPTGRDVRVTNDAAQFNQGRIAFES